MLRKNQNEHWNHEERFTQEEVEHGVVQVHMEPPLVLLIKSKHDDKSDKDFVKLKLRRDPTSENLDLYGF